MDASVAWRRVKLLNIPKARIVRVVAVVSRDDLLLATRLKKRGHYV